jgi:anaerobic magnesium-protoporphyrin IX monomethyl ester cyclase
MQLRPKALLRAVHHRDPAIAAAQRWYYRVGRRVWFHEWANFLFREHRLHDGPSVRELWGEPQVADEAPLSVAPRQPRSATAVAG